MFQIDPESGRIIIDGIDISTIGIHDLRSRLVCIFSFFQHLDLM
jgi:ABC-type multidrug transport system fused ATPase/permease subunit